MCLEIVTASLAMCVMSFLAGIFISFGVFFFLVFFFFVCSIEPYTSNIFTRRVLAGEFQIVNQHLLKDLTSLGLWTETVKNQIIAHNGSIQNVAGIPQELKGDH